MPSLVDHFVPSRGLTHHHVQTIWGKIARQRFHVATQRRRIELPDGDFTDLDVVTGNAGAPSVLLLHGLEGSSQSGYIRQMLQGIRTRGWNGYALNFRGCSGELNRKAKSYSSGDIADVEFVAHQLPGPLFIAGFSLGGSVLLNFLARKRPTVIAAATISVPFDLEQSVQSIDSGRGLMPLYQRNFLDTMRPKALEKAARFPQEIDAVAVKHAKTIRDFDACVTAPTFGFSSAEHYYAESSTAKQVTNIDVPTLILTAADDSLAPADSLPAGAESNPYLHVMRTRSGGHVGYVAGSLVRPRFFAEEQALTFFDQHLPAGPHA